MVATSPTFYGSATTLGVLSLWRWFFNEKPADAGDYFILEVSNDDGATWTELENLAGTVTDANRWTNLTSRLEHYVALTSTMQIQVRVADGRRPTRTWSRRRSTTS